MVFFQSVQRFFLKATGWLALAHIPLLVFVIMAGLVLDPQNLWLALLTCLISPLFALPFLGTGRRLRYLLRPATWHGASLGMLFVCVLAIPLIAMSFFVVMQFDADGLFAGLGVDVVGLSHSLGFATPQDMVDTVKLAPLVALACVANWASLMTLCIRYQRVQPRRVTFPSAQRNDRAAHETALKAMRARQEQRLREREQV